MKFVQALLCCSLAASAALSTRRSLLLKAPVAVATAALAPAASFASGVSLEEAAKNAEKYRVKSGVCTPTNPAECSKQYEKMRAAESKSFFGAAAKTSGRRASEAAASPRRVRVGVSATHL